MEEVVSDYFITLTGRGVCFREGEGDVLIEAFLETGVEEKLAALQGFIFDLVGHGDLPQGTHAEVTEVPEEDWMSVFRSQHHPVRISERLVVRPAWCDPVGSRDLVLDPGMAFGTGSHATTKMCLELLDGACRGRTPSRMLDLGTGSGILAIAGAMLGVREVLAVDVDPVAVDVARENVRANDVIGVVKVEEGSVERSGGGAFDIVAANLTGGLLERLAGEIADVTFPSGLVIASGITSGEKDHVVTAFTGKGFEVLRVMEESAWVGLLMQKGQEGL